MAHRQKLNKLTTIQDGFCESLSLPRDAVFGFRIENNSNNPKRIAIGRCCNISATICMDPNGSIQIGDDVWICMGALILGGVTIGDGAVVAANSVVTHEVPPMTLVAGSPARAVGTVPA